MHNQMEAIPKELRQAKNGLSDVTNRLDVVEGCLKGLEESSTSPSSDTSVIKKNKVPPQVWVRNSHIYLHKCLDIPLWGEGGGSLV